MEVANHPASWGQPPQQRMTRPQHVSPAEVENSCLQTKCFLPKQSLASQREAEQGTVTPPKSSQCACCDREQRAVLWGNRSLRAWSDSDDRPAKQRTGRQPRRGCVLGLKRLLAGEVAKFTSREELETWGSSRGFLEAAEGQLSLAIKVREGPGCTPHHGSAQSSWAVLEPQDPPSVRRTRPESAGLEKPIYHMEVVGLNSIQKTWCEHLPYTRWLQKT